MIALSKQEAKIKDVVTKALVEANAKFKDDLAKEVNKIKGFDDQDNCKNCSKSKITPKLEPQATKNDKQQSEAKQTNLVDSTK